MVQHLSGGADGRVDSLLDGLQVGKVVGYARQQGYLFVPGKGAAVVAGRGSQVADGVQFLTVEQTAQQRPADELAEVDARAELQPAAARQEPAGLRGFLQPGRHFQQVRRRGQAQGSLTAHDGAGVARQGLPNPAELQQVHRLGKPARRCNRFRVPDVRLLHAKEVHHLRG